MPKCRNDPSCYYTGKEKSPIGLGWRAHAEIIGKRRKGKDGKMYVVAKRQSGIRYWLLVTLKVKSKLKSMTGRSNKINKNDERWEDYTLETNKININKGVYLECYNTSEKQWKSIERHYPKLRLLRGEITEKLKQNDIHLLFIRSPIDIYGNQSEDYIWKSASKLLPRIKNYHVIIAPIQVDITGKKVISDTLFCKFENIDNKWKDIVINIFNDSYGEKFIWNGKEMSTIIIKLK